MRHIFVIYFFIVAMSLTQCNHDDCYHLSVQFEQDPKLEKDNPVFDSDGILGFVEESREKNGTNVAILCIFDSVKIPKNSVWIYGYIETFATRGIQVIP